MNIAIITLDFPPDTGGVQRYLYEIARRLAARHRVTVLTPVVGPAQETGVTRIIVSPRRPDRWLRHLRLLRPDRILVGHAHPRLLFIAALVAPGQYAAVAYGNDYRAAQQRWHRPIFNRLLAHAHPFITITQANARYLQSLGFPSPLVVYPGTDPQMFTPPSQETPFPPVLLTVGRLVPRKGIDTVIQALPLLRQHFPSLRYRVVGSGPDRRRLQALARRLRVHDMVEFLGRVEDALLPNIYRNAHLFVMPVREEQAGASVEGFGIVFLEAAASGLPVITSDEGGAAEALVPDKTGVLIPPQDPVTLAQVVVALLKDTERRKQMGKAGRSWVEAGMTWDHTAQRLEWALVS